MASYFLFLLLLAICHGQKATDQPQTDCEYKHDERTYNCKNLVGTFPNMFYGNYHLRCQRCSFKMFTRETFPFQNSLISFNVSDSGIQVIGHEAFSRLRNAQYLYLQRNSIRNISQGAFAGLRQVYELHLEHNLLVDLTPGFVEDMEVNSLILNDNRLTELPNKVFNKVLSLMTLELQDNRINKLYPDSFYGLDSLEFLEMQNNRLCQIPLGVFKHLRTLRHLNLANNKLTSFATGTFSGLKNLNSIVLANNSLTVFHGTDLLPFQHLSELDLSGNGIYYLDAHGVRANAPTLRNIRIDDNIFSCSLLTNIVQYLKSVNIEVINSIGRYELQNINGIACVDKIVTEPLSFNYFLKAAEDDTKKNLKYC